MNKKLIIFGTGDIAELAYYYFTNDSDYEVCGFTADRDFLDKETISGLPCVAFEDISTSFPPSDYHLFIALSYSKLNAIRKEKFLMAQQMGYELASYISSHATILNDGYIGKNCFILEDNTVQPFVKIGDNVTLWSGNHIGHHSVVSDHAFIASHVVVSGGVSIGKQCFIGVNATLRDHISIGERSVIGAGALLLESAENDAVYVGSKSTRLKIASSRLKKI